MTDLEILLTAVGAMFEPLLEVAEEAGEDGTAGFVPAYGRLLDPNTCPAKDLPYLGQFVGVEVPSGASEVEARAIVKAESGLARGTKKSLEALLAKALGVGVPFVILEREPTAYHFVIVVPTGHLPASSYPEINATKPSGLWYEVIERANTYYVGTKKYSEVGAKAYSATVEGEY